MADPAADTIAAVATAPGEAGIGVVRVSGPDALALCGAVFRPGGARWPPRPRRATLGEVLDREGGRLDDCLLTWFPAPRSYTGEEVVELACHGSNRVLARVVQGLCRAGARLADPGEFTRRAFLNGRLDLSAAEAVIDLIRAQTDASLTVANRQLGGYLGREISALRSSLIDLLAEIEAAVDFPDDVDPPSSTELVARIGRVRDRCAEMLRTAPAGRLYREGASVVLAGRPNAGKSSLLNALLGEDRAIVTPVPGTTRDLIEEGLNLGGIPVRAADTAGLRPPGDEVEALGVERTRRALRSADLVVWVVDASRPPGPEDEATARELAGRRLVAALNKRDLGAAWGGAVPTQWFGGNPPPAVEVSAVTGEGVDRLREVLAELLSGGVAPESVWISNLRQEERVAAAVESLDRALESAAAGFDLVAVALDVRIAAAALGEVTGETVTEETITRIFERFCVGK